MSDNFLSAVLTFGLMAAGTITVGSEMIVSRHRAAPTPIASVTLPSVTVVSHRPTAVVDAVTLPAVTVIGRRKAWVAVETHEQTTKVE